MDLAVSLGAAFALAIAFCLYLTLQVSNLRQQIRYRDDLIDDLRDGASKVDLQDAWKHGVL